MSSRSVVLVTEYRRDNIIHQNELHFFSGGFHAEPCRWRWANPEDPGKEIRKKEKAEEMIFWGNWRQRWECFFALAFIEFIAWLVLPFAPKNDFYFAICATFNILALLMILSLKKTRLVADLATLTYLQILLQFMGWLRYILYLDPDVYNMSIHSVVPITFIRILFAGDHDRTQRNSARPPGRRVFHRFTGLGEKQARGVST